MNILPELSAIAAAKYGLHMKDPIYRAFDKLVQDSRFELIKNPGVDDYAEFDNAMKTYANRITTCTTIRYILILIQILNGRKGYYTKKTTTPLEPRDTIFYWIDMLLKEFMNSGNGYSYDNHTRGSGVVNGIKLRAAIYYIFDILNCPSALCADTVTSGVMPSPYFFMGHDITQIVIHGTASGVGTLDTYDGKYYVDVEIYDILQDVTTTLNICLGDSALGEGETHTITSPTYSNYGDSYYRVTVKDFNCDIETNYTFTRENEITPGAVKEKTGTPPMKFYTVDTSLLDWVINGAVGGVGKLGKNYLKPRLEAIPNGAAGTWLAYAPAYVNAINGFTVNSGNATLLLFQIRHTGDTAIQPSHVGDIMMIEGSTIPSAYDADTTMYKKSIMQGNIMNHNFTANRVVGDTQELYQGDDGGGGYVEYYNAAASVPIRCKTYSIPVEQNTDYSIRVFNSSYNDIEFYTCYYSAPGTITPTISGVSPYSKKSIPGNSTFDMNTEQWIQLLYSHSRRPEYYYALPVDVRPLLYEYCDHYATLKAGSYKVMIDAWTDNNYGWGDNEQCGFDHYTGCIYDNANYTGQQGNEWFALLEEDNTVILQKQDLLPPITNRWVSVNATPPLPTYFHKEVSFTIDHDCKVGLFHKAYYESQSHADPAYFRFMIVDPDVEATYFETTGVYGAQQSGYSAWEKYQVKVSVTVYNGAVPEEAALWTKIDIPVDDFLYDGDSVSLTSSSVDITTFEGWNSITINSDIQPTIYIKYQQ